MVLIKNVAEDLNSGLLRTNPASGQSGTWTRGLLRVQPSNRSVTLPPLNVKGFFLIKVKYTATKDYNTSFLDIGEHDAQEETNYLLENLVPDSLYKFKVSGESVCVEGQPTAVDVTTKISGKQTQVQLTKI